MKFKVKTVKLKSMINKVIKGSTNNKMIPLTGLMSIVLDNGVLSLTTTDAVNFFTVKETDIQGEGFAVVLNADLFSKLVSKTTSDTITLELTGFSLQFTGNGTYKIDLPLNENGELIKFPIYSLKSSEVTEGTIKHSVIKSIVRANKPSLAVTMESPELTGYYCADDYVISADSYTICVNTVKTFPKNVLISPIVFDLLCLSDSEDISYKFTDTEILFYTDKMTLFSKNMKGIEKYPIDLIDNYIQCKFTSSCVLPKVALINVLDRLSLFISDFDVNGVYLTFTKDGVKITSSKDNASETIPYQGSENFTECTCLACVDSLKKQIQAIIGDTVNLYYGVEEAIKLVDNNVTQIIALLEDDSDMTDDSEDDNNTEE